MSRRRSRSAQRRTAAVARPAASRPVARPPSSPASTTVDEPEPWPRTALLVLVALAVLLQCLSSVVFYFVNHRTGAYAWYVVLLPYQFPPLVFALSFLVAMPFAQRLARQARPMRFLETLAFAAVALLAIFAVTGPVGEATLRLPWAAELAALAAAEAAAYAVAVVAFPFVYRRFWMPRRRFGRR